MVSILNQGHGNSKEEKGLLKMKYVVIAFLVWEDFKKNFVQ